MSVRDDAIFLAGFVVGTYDLRDDSRPPAYIQSFIERIVGSVPSHGSTVTQKVGDVSITTVADTDIKQHLDSIKAAEENAEIELPPITRMALEMSQSSNVALVVPKHRGWQPWQIATLKKMKENGENIDSIAKACEKTPTEVDEYLAKYFPTSPKLSIEQIMAEVGELTGDENITAREHSGATSEKEGNPVKTLPLGNIPEKKKRAWSPEARAAAGDRMRARMAVKNATGTTETPQVTHSVRQVTPASPQVSTSSIAKSSQANTYAGRRFDGIVRDSDWPDIKEMLGTGCNILEIAKKYGCPTQEMKEFIDKKKAGK